MSAIIYRMDRTPHARVAVFDDETEAILCLRDMGMALGCNLRVSLSGGSPKLPLPDKAAFEHGEVIYRPLDMQSFAYQILHR